MTTPVSLWSSGRATGKKHCRRNHSTGQLDGIRASALSYYRELSSIRTKVTAEDVKTLLLGMAHGQQTLLAYFREHNMNFNERVGVNRKSGTAATYRYALNQLTEFLKVKYKLSDITFAALDRSFIDKYDLYLRTERGLGQGTIVMLTIRLNTIMTNAIAEGIITGNPFAGHKAQRPKPVQKYLTRKELYKLMSTPMTSPNHYLIRDLFLFSCYTGIPYGDMCKLTDEDISPAPDGALWIKTCREKTGIDYELPLLEIPLQILDRYKGIADKGRLLPMFSNSALNRQLKEIASTCGINAVYTSTWAATPTPARLLFHRVYLSKRLVGCSVTVRLRRHRFTRISPPIKLTRI